MNDEVLKSIAKTQATVQVLLTQLLEMNIDQKDGFIKEMIKDNVDKISETIYRKLKNSQ